MGGLCTCSTWVWDIQFQCLQIGNNISGELAAAGRQVASRLDRLVRMNQLSCSTCLMSCMHMQMQYSQQQRTPGQLADPSQQVHAASPVPDAKSAAAPLGAAHSCPSSEDEEETSPPASQTSSGRYAQSLAIAQCSADNASLTDASFL